MMDMECAEAERVSEPDIQSEWDRECTSFPDKHPTIFVKRLFSFCLCFYFYCTKTTEKQYKQSRAKEKCEK